MRHLTKTILVLAFLAGSSTVNGQKLVFQDLNQELMGLVGSVASNYDVRSNNFPIRFYERYCDLYDELSALVENSPAVGILRPLLRGDGEIDMHEVHRLAIISQEGFTGFKDEYELPPYLADPSHKLYGQITALLENMRELYGYGPLREYFTTRYREDYQDVMDGSGVIFQETDRILGYVGQILSISPPENYVNYFCLLSMPNQNFGSVQQMTDGTRLAFGVTGITYSEPDKYPEFNISPELVFNMYGFSVIDNARRLYPGYAAGLTRLDTPAVREFPMYEDYFDSIEEYIMGNAVPALTAYMFESIGNDDYGDYLVMAYGELYIYMEKMIGILREHFSGSGQSFYDFFPAWFDALVPVQ